MNSQYPKIRSNSKIGGEFVQNTLRFPPSMYEALKSEAKRSGRSLHGEILHRLGLTLGEEYNLKAETDNASMLMSMSEDIKALRAIAEALTEKAPF